MTFEFNHVQAPGSFSGPIDTTVSGGGWLMIPYPAMSYILID